MLGLTLQRHLAARGLVVDKKRNRAYFPRSASGPRKVTYQARVQRATRTVAKARGKRKDGTPSYWEHASLGYRFEKFGDTWALVLVPSYVFTYDGRRGLLDGARVNRLSTKRQSRDYNSSAHYNLIFWLWVLSGGDGDKFSLYDGPSPSALDSSFPEGDDPYAIVGQSDDDEDGSERIDDREIDEEGYSVLGDLDPPEAPYLGEETIRLRSHLPTAVINEIVVGEGAAGEAEDEGDLVEILADEAEKERQAAEQIESESTSTETD